MKAFLFMLVTILFSRFSSFAQKDTSWVVSVGYSYNIISGKSFLKNFNRYAAQNDERSKYFGNIFDNTRSTQYPLGNGLGTVWYYPKEIMRKNINVLSSIKYVRQKKNKIFRISANYLQRDFTTLNSRFNGFTKAVNSIKNQTIYGNSCFVFRYNSNIFEIPITYGFGFNRKHFIGNINFGLNTSFLTMEQTYHRRILFDANTQTYKDEGLIYIESDKFRFYKVNLTTSVETGFKIKQTFALTINATHDFRTVFQTTKNLEIIHYSKSMAGLTLYYYF